MWYTSDSLWVRRNSYYRIKAMDNKKSVADIRPTTTHDFSGLPKIAEICSLSDSNVKNTLQALKEKGFIEYSGTKKRAVIRQYRPS